eukprot:5714793-Amphidinium_carterae.1
MPANGVMSLVLRQPVRSAPQETTGHQRTPLNTRTESFASSLDTVSWLLNFKVQFQILKCATPRRHTSFAVTISLITTLIQTAEEQTANVD